MKLETLAVHAGRSIDPHSHAVTPSIHPSVTFERAADGSFPSGHIYSRFSNPNRAALEKALASLENGQEALAFSSGQAATAAIFQSLAAGEHVILGHDTFYGTRHLAQQQVNQWGLELDLVNMRQSEQVAAAIRPNTRLVWVETPSNPQLGIADIATIAQIAHQNGALCVVDNTWATPLLQHPLALGADIAMHSTTKYISGHSDVLGGALVLNDGALAAKLRNIQQLHGAVPSPFDAWLLLRSIPTLPYRVRAQVESAARIAAFLEIHPRIRLCHYPGLMSHPNHFIAASQMEHFGAMLSFEVGGGQAAAMEVAGRLKIITRATSLGGVESLIEHRASVEGPDSPTPPALLRLSVGLEHVDDLLDDLAQALA